MAVTFEEVRKVALSIPKVAEGLSYGTPAFKINGKLFVRLRDEIDSIVLRTAFEEREAMLADDPETFYITDHYLKYPWVLVRLSELRRDLLPDLLRRACRLASPPKNPSSRF